MTEHHHHPHDEQCIELFSRLSEFIDGELDQPLRFLVEQHLAECKACRVCLTTLERTIDLCRHSGQAPLPEALSQRLNRMIADLQKDPKSS